MFRMILYSAVLMAGIHLTAKELPMIGQKYRHYSGKEYEIIAMALDHNLEEVVVYRALYEDPKLGKDVIWVRSLKEWNEPYLKDGVSVTRYAQCSE